MRDAALVLLGVSSLPFAMPFIMAGITHLGGNVVATARSRPRWGVGTASTVHRRRPRSPYYPMLFAGRSLVAVLPLIVEFLARRRAQRATAARSDSVLRTITAER